MLFGSVENCGPMRHRPLRKSYHSWGRGGCPHPPANPHQLLRLVATGALSSSSLPDSPRITRPAAATRKRSQSAAPPAPALRYSSPGSVPRNGGPGAGDWSAGAPRSQPPGHFWFLFGQTKRNIPQKGNSAARKSVPAPTAGGNRRAFHVQPAGLSANYPASGSGAEAQSISCTTRAGVAVQFPGMRPL